MVIFFITIIQFSTQKASKNKIFLLLGILELISKFAQNNKDSSEKNSFHIFIDTTPAQYAGVLSIFSIQKNTNKSRIGRVYK